MFLIKIKTQACMIDFMFAVSTLTNQKELLQSTQKGGANSQLQKDLNEANSATASQKLEALKLEATDDLLESLNRKASELEDYVIKLLGKDMGKVKQLKQKNSC